MQFKTAEEIRASKKHQQHAEKSKLSEAEILEMKRKKAAEAKYAALKREHDKREGKKPKKPVLVVKRDEVIVPPMVAELEKRRELKKTNTSEFQEKLKAVIEKVNAEPNRDDLEVENEVMDDLEGREAGKILSDWIVSEQTKATTESKAEEKPKKQIWDHATGQWRKLG